MRITADGTVGINTDNTGGNGLGVMVDSSNTNVLATGGIALNLKNKNSTDNTWVAMDFNNSAGGIVGRFGAQFADTSDKTTDLFFCTRKNSGALTERLRISRDGALGIAGANYGTSGQVLTSGGSAAAPSWAAASGGPTHYTKFTLENVTGNQNPINNWDVYSPGISPTINTAVTNTGGIFSFPVTGIWETQASILFYLNGGTTEWRLETYGTTNDGTNWDIIGRQYGWFHNNSSTNYMSVSTMPFLLDITDTSNCKIKFVIAGGPGTLNTGGDDNDLYSGCHFIRWADT